MSTHVLTRPTLITRKYTEHRSGLCEMARRRRCADAMGAAYLPPTHLPACLPTTMVPYTGTGEKAGEEVSRRGRMVSSTRGTFAHVGRPRCGWVPNSDFPLLFPSFLLSAFPHFSSTLLLLYDHDDDHELRGYGFTASFQLQLRGIIYLLT